MILQVGDIVKVYKDPETCRKIEFPAAKIVRIYSDGADRNDFVACLVFVKRPKSTYYRAINIKNC